MAISFRSTTTANTATGTTLTINKPAGVVDGDLLIANIVQDQDPSTPTAPSGWTLGAHVDAVSDGLAYSWYWKIASSEPASWEWTTLVNAIGRAGSVDAYYDTVGGGAFALSTSTTNETTPATTHPISAITSANSSLLLCSFSNDSTSTVTTPPAGMTAAGTGSELSVETRSYYELITTGATENRSITWGTADSGISFAAVFTYGSTASIDTLGTITPGATGVAFTYSGMTGTPTGMTLSDGTNSFSVTSFSATGSGSGSGTFDCPAIMSIGSMLTSGTYTITATLTDGTDSPTTTATFNPQASYTLVTPTGTWLTTDDASFAYLADGNLTTADQFLYPTALLDSIDAADGHFVIAAGQTGVHTCYVIDHTTFGVTSFTVTVTSVGTGRPGMLRRIGILKLG